MPQISMQMPQILNANKYYLCNSNSQHSHIIRPATLIYFIEGGIPPKAVIDSYYNI